MSRRRVLVVDDDPAARQLMRMVLESGGGGVGVGVGVVFTAPHDGITALQVANDTHPDLIMLDLSMPLMDGWLACQRIREVWDTPIIMVTATKELEARVRGLQIGADDYIAKPFDIDELLMRVRAVMRRASERPYLERPARYADEYLVVDLASGQVLVNGEVVALTPTEFGLLRYLVQHPNEPVTSEALLQAVWGDQYDDAEATLRVHLHHLRRKIEKDPRKPRYLKTERGVGYRFQSAV
jgi:two-component system KDP operon response regulator KdpE